MHFNDWVNAMNHDRACDLNLLVSKAEVAELISRIDRDELEIFTGNLSAEEYFAAAFSIGDAKRFHLRRTSAGRWVIDGWINLQSPLFSIYPQVRLTDLCGKSSIGTPGRQAPGYKGDRDLRMGGSGASEKQTLSHL